MWAVLWNIWYFGGETKVVPELDFAWATDPIRKLDSCTIFHNAGVSKEEMNGFKCFHKGKYHSGKNPTTDKHLFEVLKDEKSKNYCTWFYASKLLEVYRKYSLDY